MRSRSEMIFLKILFSYLSAYFTAVNCWKFVKSSDDLDRRYAEGLEGTDVCTLNRNNYKKRYFVCTEATKAKFQLEEETKVLPKTNLFPLDSLGKAEEMKNKEYTCKNKVVHYPMQYKEDQTWLTSNADLFSCPTTNKNGQMYFFASGKNKDEIGIYKKQKLEGKTVYGFIGIMEGIDLKYLGNKFMRGWNKIPILKWFAPW